MGEGRTLKLVCLDPVLLCITFSGTGLYKMGCRARLVLGNRPTVHVRASTFLLVWTDLSTAMPWTPPLGMHKWIGSAAHRNPSQQSIKLSSNFNALGGTTTLTTLCQRIWSPFTTATTSMLQLLNVVQLGKCYSVLPCHGWSPTNSLPYMIRNLDLYSSMF